MTTGGQRACVVCGKPAEKHRRYCGVCQMKRMRATYVGARGCSVCGGKSILPAGVCRKCWDAACRRAVTLIKDEQARGEFRQDTPASLRSLPRHFDGEES